jgi:rhamnose transport system permease protein
MTTLSTPGPRLRRLIRGRAPRPYLGMPGWNTGLVAAIIIAGLWASLSSPAFLNLSQLLSSGQSVVVTALLALGLAPVVITGEIDISLTSNLALSAVLAGLAAQSGLPGIVVILVALAAGIAGGLLNGVLVALSGMPSLAVTLGTMGAYQGAAYLIGGDNGYSSYPSAVARIGTYYIGQVPVALILFLVVAVVFAAILGATTLGRSMYVTGRSAEVVRRNGSSVAGAKLLAFGLGGLTAGIAALVFVGYYGSGSGSSASGTILLVVTAVALGGLDIYGGSGRISSVVLATVLIGVLQDGMGLLNVNTTLQTIVTGLLLIVSLSIARLLTSNPGWRGRLLRALRVRRGQAPSGA